MPHFVIERYADIDLEFDGELIADVNSDEGQPRYGIIRIYATDSGKFVLERLGMSRRPGERTLINVSIHDEPEDLMMKGLRFRNDTGKRYITDLALDAIDDAAQFDERFKLPDVERI